MGTSDRQGLFRWRTLFDECLKIGEARATYRRLLLISSGESVGRLQPVAGDACDGEFIPVNSSVGVEARSERRRDTAGGFGKDAFGFGQFLDARDDLHIGDVFGPTTALADRARGVDAVRRIADGEGTHDGVGP